MQEDVLRLEIPVDHAASVGIVDRCRDRRREMQCFLDGQLLLPIELRAQRLALDEGHDVIQQSFRLTRVEQRKQVRVLKISRDFDLGEEPLDAKHGSQLGIQDLQRDSPVVFLLIGEIHRGHSTAPDLTVKAIATEEEPVQVGQRVYHDEVLVGSTNIRSTGARRHNTTSVIVIAPQKFGER